LTRDPAAPSVPGIRVLEPAPGVLAFYAGRDGSSFAAAPNWVDEGALSLGIASYALIAGDEAIVYDTGISVGWGSSSGRSSSAAPPAA
jgi:cyclase